MRNLTMQSLYISIQMRWCLNISGDLNIAAQVIKKVGKVLELLDYLVRQH